MTLYEFDKSQMLWETEFEGMVDDRVLVPVEPVCNLAVRPDQSLAVLLLNLQMDDIKDGRFAIVKIGEWDNNNDTTQP